MSHVSCSIRDLPRKKRKTILAIVGSSNINYWKCAKIINDYIKLVGPDKIISGACHLGGVDEHAITLAKMNNIPYEEYPSKTKQWNGSGGFKERNTLIAKKCTHLLCIRSRRSRTYGSGWTVDYAEKIGKMVFRKMID